MSQKITVAYGDGIGPEIMQVVLDILKSAGARFSNRHRGDGRKGLFKRPSVWDKA